MLISKAFYRHLPIFLNLFKCPLRGSKFQKKNFLGNYPGTLGQKFKKKFWLQLVTGTTIEKT